MIESKHRTNTTMVSATLMRRSALAIGVALFAGGISAPAAAELSFEADSGWKFGVNGHIPVFALVSDNDNLEEDAFRITTGFNPATAQFNVHAPTQNGLDVSGHIQLNSHLSGADGVQNSGFGQVDFGRQSGVESRVAEIAVSGDFGALNIGKGFGIYGTPGIGDAGSGMGVGLFNPNQGDATAGRIGNGYFYANFNPRVIYTSPSMGGLQFKAGLFQPEKPKDGDLAAQVTDTDGNLLGVNQSNPIDDSVGTESPRVEANLVWSGDLLKLWAGGFTQNVEVEDPAVEDFTMSGVDFGGAVALGSFNLRANYGLTQGTGNAVFGGHGVTGGAEEEDADQWYVEGTYDVTNRATLGVSYGEGSDDLSDVDTDLTMVFARYKATDAWTILAEVQDFSTDVPDSDSSAVIVGAQLTF
ncbi:MAG: porin [Marinobacter sp.]